MLKRGLWLCVLLGVITTGAYAGAPFRERETNNTVSSAYRVAGVNTPAVAFEGTLGPDGTISGVDFAELEIPSSLPLVTISVFDYTPGKYDHDSYIGVYHPDRTLWEVADDGNPGLLSSIHFRPVVPGRWRAAVTGLGDFYFAGRDHNQRFDYRIVVSMGATATERGDNDTAASSQALPAKLLVTGAASVEGRLAPDSTPGGIDFYSLNVKAGTLVTAALFDFTPVPEHDTDGLLAVYGPDGELVASDDAGGVDFLPAIHFVARQGGTYTVAVTGWPDFDFDGRGHSEVFDYRLVISTPEPASLTFLAIGAAVAGRRRRR